MLDNGFSLSRVELLNWGNFHGYQKLSLYEPSENGQLFQPQAASAILGINGSGKSTLIDAMMIVMLPFEGSLKLGVTNDVEAGSGGGRTIRDYVLGKHSSHGGGAVADFASIYGRKDGCSMALLHFTHNRDPERSLTIGRCWWYQNYKVSETQVAFLAYQALGIQDLCAEGKTPATAKAFRQHLKAHLPHVQLFETMQNYFSAMSGALGRISRDDLKILNRAFFVKSISNIDQFIRENMLVEQESPNLDRLMENVRNGREIAFSIETCQEKIAAIARILKELNRLAEFIEAGRKADRRLRLLSLHREWREWQDLIVQRGELLAEIAALEGRKPRARSEAESAMAEWRASHGRLVTDDTELKLASLNAEVRLLEAQVETKQGIVNSWMTRAKTLDLHVPKSSKGWPAFLRDLENELPGHRERGVKLAGDLEMSRERRYANEAAVREVREEMEHVSRSGTLIPRELCAVRDLALRALKIPRHHLMFVGELLQVKSESREMRPAVESVLFPIARNLLCHPDHLHALTKWLDAEGLRSDVTVKRISAEELLGNEKAMDLDEERVSILGFLEMKSAKDHPFSVYLWRWLRDAFDYELVDVKRFKGETGRLVTREGLAKKDHRTMRKPRQGFPFSLGWDNAERVEELASALVRLNDERARILATIETLTNEQRRCEDRSRLLEEIQRRFHETGGIEEDVARIERLKADQDVLTKSHPDLQTLRDRVRELDEQAQTLTRSLLALEAELDSKSSRLTKVEGLLPGREHALKDSKLYRDLSVELQGEENLFGALQDIEAELQRRAVNRLQLDGEAKEEAQRAEQGRARAISMAAVNLGQYRSKFNDPNLPYDLSADVKPEVFLREWAAVDQRLRDTELPKAQEKWRRFFDQILLDSVKDMINEIKSRIHEVQETVRSINEVLKLTNFEDLGTDQRYLCIDLQTAEDERVRKFRKQMVDVEKTLSPTMRAQIEAQSTTIMTVLSTFVETFQNDPAYRAHVTDVRNHFQFSVHSLRRIPDGPRDEVVEIFSGSRKDAKSSAQTTQLAYALLASCLAFRFHFHDAVAGSDTPRLIVFDEFGGKFDNEKPREILKLLDKMGFQSVLVSPMSKADILADGIGHLVLVHKVSASRSKAQSYRIDSRDDYDRLLKGSSDRSREAIAAKDAAIETAER
jgi:uncharacterized protein YPO0396